MGVLVGKGILLATSIMGYRTGFRVLVCMTLPVRLLQDRETTYECLAES